MLRNNPSCGNRGVSKPIGNILLLLLWMSIGYCCLAASSNCFAQNPGPGTTDTTSMAVVTNRSQLLKQGIDQFNARMYSQADQTFTEMENEFPSDSDALQYHSKVLIHLKRYAEAESDLRAYLKLHPNSSDATYLLAYVQFCLNRPRVSLATYTAAAKLTKPTSDDLKIVGLDYGILNDFKDAIHWLSVSIQENPKDLEAVNYLGLAYFHDSQFPAAVKTYRYVLQRDPHNVRAETGLGRSLDALNQPDKAIDAYTKAIAWSQDSTKPTDQPYINLASIMLDRNRPQRALKLLNQAAKINPKDSELHVDYGKAYLQLKHWPEAEREFKMALDSEPKNSNLHFLLGRAYQRDNKLELAKEQFNATSNLLGTHSNTADNFQATPAKK